MDLDFRIEQQVDDVSDLFATTHLNDQGASGVSYSGIQASGSSKMHAGDVNSNTVNNYNISGLPYNFQLPALLRQGYTAKDASDLGPKLVMASREGQKHRVRQLLGQSADVNYRDDLSLTALHWAALKGYDDVVKDLLDAGADVNWLSDFLGSPLCLAALKGHVKVVKMLLNHRASLNVEDDCPLGSPLHCACWSGNVVLIQAIVQAVRNAGKRKLIDLIRAVHEDAFKAGELCADTYRGQGAGEDDSDDEEDPKSENDEDLDENDLDDKGGEGRRIRQSSFENYTPLMIAAERGHLQATLLLIQEGANLRICTPQSYRRGDAVNGGTALIAAASGGQLEIMHTLLEHGADIHKAGTDGITALEAAAYAGCTEGVTELIGRGASLACRGTDKYSALMVAAACMRQEQRPEAPILQDFSGTVRLLLTLGVDVNARSRSQQTPLMFIGLHPEGHDELEIVEMLLAHGADINAQDERGYTALLYASRFAPSVASYLLEKGANVSLRAEDGMSALHVAALFDHDGLVFEMIACGAKVDWRGPLGPGGNTALILAAGTDKLKAVKALLDSGADAVVDVENEDGMTALSCACQSGSVEVAEALLGAGAQPRMTHLFGAILKGSLRLARLLLESGADLNVGERRQGQSPLHWAARAGLPAFIKLFLKHEANINSRDDEKRTPLSCAAGNGHVKAVEALLKAGADASLLDQVPLDALGHAVAAGQLPVVKYMHEEGVITEATYGHGVTLLCIAAMCGELEVVKYLIEEGADVDAVDEDGWTAFHFAVRTKHKDAEEIATILYTKMKNPPVLEDRGRQSPAVQHTRSPEQPWGRASQHSPSPSRLSSSQHGSSPPPSWIVPYQQPLPPPQYQYQQPVMYGQSDPQYQYGQYQEQYYGLRLMPTQSPPSPQPPSPRPYGLQPPSPKPPSTYGLIKFAAQAYITSRMARHQARP